ncbi:MAG: hypothetical protein GXO82_00700 [Chlorobi bacterium]|nr:hypothetical protein [Chlorobiota bacterium]
MMSTRLMIALVFFVFLFPIRELRCQETQKTPEENTQEIIDVTKQKSVFNTTDVWGIGLNTGLLSGIGLSTRFHPRGRFCFQLTGGYLGLEDQALWAVGGEGQFDFDATVRSRFYGYLGLGLYYQDKPEESKNKLKAPFRMGIGIAYEWSISPKLIFNANVAFTYFVASSEVLPLPQLGLYYYFN